MKWKASVVSLLVSLATACVSVVSLAQPEPGPENGGLRLRFVVLPHPDTNGEGYDVHVDLINATNRDITLRIKEREYYVCLAYHYPTNATNRKITSYTQEGSGSRDIKDLLERAINIETYPAIAPLLGQVVGCPSSEVEHVHKAGEVMSLEWHTVGRHLKNSVSNPLSVQNPEFPFVGLYSVHAILELNIGGQPVFLRSNEQLVPVGGSRELSKSTYGRLTQVDANKKSANLNLGSLQKIEIGDEFNTQTPIQGDWKLTITHITPNYAVGNLEPWSLVGTPPTNLPPFPKEQADVTFVARH